MKKIDFKKVQLNPNVRLLLKMILMYDNIIKLMINSNNYVYI